MVRDKYDAYHYIVVDMNIVPGDKTIPPGDIHWGPCEHWFRRLVRRVRGWGRQIVDPTPRSEREECT